MKWIVSLVTIYFPLTMCGQSAPVKPFVLGQVNEIRSVVLSETRTLNIYLPEGYAQNDTVHYPVIYLLDGSADEDFIHVAGRVQYNSTPWIKRVPPSIVVGIANVDRKRDFTSPSSIASDKKKEPTSGGSAKFIDFIEKELQPYIDKTFRTTYGKTLIGQSLGGLLATEVLLKKPFLFDTFIIISPSIWWNNGSLLKEESALLTASFSQKTKIYIGVGKEGLTPTDPPRVMEVDANLLAEKIKRTKSSAVSSYFDYLPQDNHATAGHQALMNAFRWLSGN